MKRDGANKSIWQDINDYKPVNSWQKDNVYDVLIIGGGITGLSTALLLQMEGKKCILAEANTIGFGATGGTTAHLNTILDTNYADIEKTFGPESARLVAKGTREAIDMVEDLTDAYHISSDFSYKSGYLFAQTNEEATTLEGIIKAAKNAGVVAVCVDSIPVPCPFLKAARFDFQGQVHPTKYLNGLARAFEKEGGVILQQCVVKNVKEENYCIAETSLGQLFAYKSIYATHIPPGISLLTFENAPYRSYAIAFTPKNNNYPEGLAYDLKEPYHYFRSHKIGDVSYIIAGGFDHKTGHNDNTAYIFTELEAFVRQYYDVEQVAYRWSSQYYQSADSLPYIGLMPGTKNIYVATGFGGNGMTLGSLSAKVLCGLIINGDSPYEKLFSPSRIKPIAGFSRFLKENADVAGEFIGKRFSYEKISTLAELAHGEATIANWEGKHVALYKDEQGHIYTLDPVCPHAKCIVTWNNTEKSWDCPCHGGRYAPNGALLTGPASKGLAQIKWEEIDGD